MASKTAQSQPTSQPLCHLFAAPTPQKPAFVWPLFRYRFNSNKARQTVRWRRFRGLEFAPAFAAKPGLPSPEPPPEPFTKRAAFFLKAHQSQSRASLPGAWHQKAAASLSASRSFAAAHAVKTVFVWVSCSRTSEQWASLARMNPALWAASAEPSPGPNCAQPLRLIDSLLIQ